MCYNDKLRFEWTLSSLPKPITYLRTAFLDAELRFDIKRDLPDKSDAILK